MHDNRSAGEFNLSMWNEVRGVVRRYDYLDIKQGMKQNLQCLMEDKLAELDSGFISRIKNSSDIATLKQKLIDFKTCNISWVVKQFNLNFPLEDYKVVSQASDICHSFNGLFNRIKEYDKGTLSTVHITQGELYSVNWLRNNKPKLKELVHQEYKHLVDLAKEERSSDANYNTSDTGNIIYNKNLNKALT